MGNTLHSNIGLTVVDKGWKMRGVIIAVTNDVVTGHPNQLLIRTWSKDLNRYILFSKHYKLVGHLPETANINEDDAELRKRFKDSCLDLAVMTNDKEWFEKLHKM